MIVKTAGGKIQKNDNQAQDTGRGDLIVQPKYPIGTDPKAMDQLIEDEIARRGLVAARQTKTPEGDRAKIFNDALLKAVGHKDTPPEVKAAMKTEDGDELEIVEEPLPKILDPHRKGQEDE